MAVTRDTLDRLRQQVLTVGSTVDQATRRLAQAWIRAFDELHTQWSLGTQDAAEYALTNGTWPGPSQLARLDRLQAALGASEQRLGQLARQTGVEASAGAESVVAATAELEPVIIASQLPAAEQAQTAINIAANVLPSALAAIVARTQSDIVALAKPLSPAAMEAMRRELIRGVAVGDNPTVVAKAMLDRVQGAFEGGLTRATVIARTEMLDAYRATAAQVHAANADVLRGWRWLSQRDDRTCVACWSMNGREFPLSQPGPWDHPQGRCARLPVTKSWADLGIKGVAEPADVAVDAQAQFFKLPPTAQQAIMGSRRLELLRSGQVNWEDLAYQRAVAGWRPSFQPRAVQDLETLAARRRAAGIPAVPHPLALELPLPTPARRVATTAAPPPRTATSAHPGVPAGQVPGNPAEVTGYQYAWWTQAKADTGLDNWIPVRDMRIESTSVTPAGYIVKSGRIYRIDGVSYLIEDPAIAESIVEDLRKFHKTLPKSAAGYQKGYAWLLGRNPADGYWERTYKTKEFRSVATAGYGVTTLWQPTPAASRSFGELRHEFGHNVSSAVRRQDLHAESKAWRDAGAADFALDREGLEFYPLFATIDVSLPVAGRPYPEFLKDLATRKPKPKYPAGVTGYGTSAIGEDYAESVWLYLHGQIGSLRVGGEKIPVYFRDLFPNRAAVLDQVFPRVASAQKTVVARLSTAPIARPSPALPTAARAAAKTVAPPADPALKLTVAQLKTIAKDNGILIPSGLTKPDLVAHIRYWEFGQRRAVLPARPRALPEPSGTPLTGRLGLDWSRQLTEDTGPGGRPVRDLYIGQDYTVTNGTVWRIDGVTYLIEHPVLDPIRDVDRLGDLKTILDELQDFHRGQPRAQELNKSYAWVRGANPHDPYWAERYGKPEFRAQASAADGRITVWGQPSLQLQRPRNYFGTLTHETGHNLDTTLARLTDVGSDSGAWGRAALLDRATAASLSEFTETQRPGWFMHGGFGQVDRDAAWPDGVTSYGRNADKEDFAESFMLYLRGQVGTGRIAAGDIQPVFFRDVYPNRARLFDALFPDFARGQLEEIAALRATDDVLGGPLDLGKALPRFGQTHTAAQAVARQVQVDALRARADLAAETHQLVGNGVEPAVLRRRLQALGDRLGVNVSRLVALADDPAVLLRAVDKAAGKLGLTRVGTAGERLGLDRTLHNLAGAAPKPGESVEIIRPGYIGRLPSGEDVQLFRADVQASGETAVKVPAPVKVTPRVAADTGDFSQTGRSQANDDLRRRVEAGILEKTATKPGQGVSAVTHRIRLADGSYAYRKVTHLADETLDDEYLDNLVMQAVGAPTPGVYRANARTLFLQDIPGRLGRDADLDPLTHPDSRLIGLGDALTGTGDRVARGPNYVVTRDGRIVAIDNAPAQFWDADGRLVLYREVDHNGVPLPHQDVDSNPFIDRYVDRGPDGRGVRGKIGSEVDSEELRGFDDSLVDVWRDNDLTAEEITAIRARLVALAPEFEQLDRLDWHRFLIARFDAIASHSKAAAKAVAKAAAPAADLSKLTVVQLRALARERGVVLPARALKADIVAALKGEKPPVKAAAKAVKKTAVPKVPARVPATGEDLLADDATISAAHRALRDAGGTGFGRAYNPAAFDAIAQRQGFNDLPRIVADDAAWQRLIDAGYLELYRGNGWAGGDGVAQVAEFAHGKRYAGGGFAPGTNMSPRYKTALHYADGHDAAVGRYLLRSDAKIVHYEDLVAQRDAYLARLGDGPQFAAQRAVFAGNEGLGAFAAARGYDAMVVPQGAYGLTDDGAEWVVFNRSKVVAFDDSARGVETAKATTRAAAGRLPAAEKTRRALQADLEAGYQVGNLGLELLKLLSEGADAGAWWRRIRAYGALLGTPQDVVAAWTRAAEAGDPAALRAAIEAAFTDARLTPVESAGGVVRFDPALHHAWGVTDAELAIPDGAQVFVVRPGLTLTRGGKTIQLVAARVRVATPAEIKAATAKTPVAKKAKKTVAKATAKKAAREPAWMSTPIGSRTTAAGTIDQTVTVRASLAEAPDIKTIHAVVRAEAKALGAQRFGSISLQGHDLQTAREHAEGILQALERFPRIRVSVDHFTHPAGVYGAYGETTGWVVRFNTAFARTAGREEYLAALRSDLEQGWHPAGTGTPAAVALHEFGHAVDFFFTKMVDIGTGMVPKSQLGEAVTALVLRMAEKAGMAADDYIRSQLGGYALKHRAELFAEAFADAMVNGEKASELAKAIFGLVEDAYRRFEELSPL